MGSILALMPERTDTSNVVAWVVGIVAVALVAWFLWAAFNPATPGIPNTGATTTSSYSY